LSFGSSGKFFAPNKKTMHHTIFFLSADLNPTTKSSISQRAIGRYKGALDLIFMAKGPTIRTLVKFFKKTPSS